MNEVTIAELKHSGQFHIMIWQENSLYWLSGTGKAECGTIGWFNGAHKVTATRLAFMRHICGDCMDVWNKKRKDNKDE